MSDKDTNDELARARRRLRDAASAMITHPRDWSLDHRDAWLWGVVIGWDDASLAELATTHGWSEKTVDKLRECRERELARSNSQWHEDQTVGERIQREHAQKRELDSRLGDALRASEISASDAQAVQALYATAGVSGSHRIVSALRAIEAWIREGGAS